MDRITRVRIKNVRAIEYVDLELSRSLTVLIGENGSGKSTILECLELLRRAADPSFMEHFYNRHGGMPALLRKGSAVLELGVVVEDDEQRLPRIEYNFSLAPRMGGAFVQYELLLVGPMDKAQRPLVALRRSADHAEMEDEPADSGTMFDQRERKLVPIPQAAMRSDQLAIASFGSLPPQKAIGRLLDVLRGIEVHLPFDTIASWAARSYQFSRSMRATAMIRPAERLELLGLNLVNAWFEINNSSSEIRDHANALVRLGLGEHIDSVIVKADMGGGQIALALKLKAPLEPILATELSDGQMSWLAFIAMTQLNSGRTLLAVDEPELHLHPHLLAGVIALLSRLDAPVLVSTHADRVLETLDDPADAVRVCRLDERGRATALHVDPAELPKWIEHFGDFAGIRAAGYLSRVLLPAPEQPAEEGE